jgi:hypothetical protein
MEARPAAPGRTKTTAGTRTRTLAAERPRPILSAEPAGANTASSQPDNQAQAAPAPIIADPTATKARPRLFTAEAIKNLFRQVAKTVIKDLVPKLRPRRKRTEETQGGFNAIARAIVRRVSRLPVARSIFDGLYAPRSYDPEQEHAYAEYVQRMQIEESTHNGEPQPDEAFQYGSTAHFDAHL